ncbi:hypothetical protein TNCV_1530061 [Trichonephila clavipes]|uniref:Uncharacterized protein n=1 Tax=Trichonephila clavipes TaxID=2585209 RepID=A0A8X6VLG9_TRICX|nr:hypothetical protein TNCV_1530061 [Trichonephila clavipes]
MIMCVQPQLRKAKAFWSLFNDKKIIDADSDDKNEMNNAAPVSRSFEKRNVMKSMRSVLDAHSKGLTESVKKRNLNFAGETQRTPYKGAAGLHGSVDHSLRTAKEIYSSPSVYRNAPRMKK